MKITCPKCRNVGQADGTDRRFEARGKYQGNPVYKCLNCKSGLQSGLMSGMIFRRTKYIPERKWFDLEAEWARESLPSYMQESDMAELGLMLHSMFGFVHGYTRLLSEIESDITPSPEQFFYLNALRSMCVNYFVATTNSPPDVSVRNILAKHGLSHLVAPIDRLLETPLGSTEFKSILKRFRNKYLTHELFQLQPLEKIYDAFDMRDFSKWIVYHQLERNIFSEIVRLFYTLRERHPAAWIRAADLIP